MELAQNEGPDPFGGPCPSTTVVEQPSQSNRRFTAASWFEKFYIGNFFILTPLYPKMQKSFFFFYLCISWLRRFLSSGFMVVPYRILVKIRGYFDTDTSETHFGTFEDSGFLKISGLQAGNFGFRFPESKAYPSQRPLRGDCRICELRCSWPWWQACRCSARGETRGGPPSQRLCAATAASVSCAVLGRGGRLAAVQRREGESARRPAAVSRRRCLREFKKGLQRTKANIILHPR